MRETLSPLTPAIALEAVASLAALRFFPPDPPARAALADELLRMCRSEDQAAWVVRRVLRLYNEWPGPMELRAVFCSRFKPADGVEANTTDARFREDGFPPEVPLLPEPATLRLLPGQTTADPDMRTLVATMARAKKLR